MQIGAFNLPGEPLRLPEQIQSSKITNESRASRELRRGVLLADEGEYFTAGLRAREAEVDQD